MRIDWPCGASLRPTAGGGCRYTDIYEGNAARILPTTAAASAARLQATLRYILYLPAMDSAGTRTRHRAGVLSARPPSHDDSACLCRDAGSRAFDFHPESG